MNTARLKRDLLTVLDTCAAVGALESYEEDMGERILLDVLKHYGIDAGAPSNRDFRLDPKSREYRIFSQLVDAMDMRWLLDERQDSRKPHVPFRGKVNEPITFAPHESPKV